MRRVGRGDASVNAQRRRWWRSPPGRSSLWSETGTPCRGPSGPPGYGEPIRLRGRFQRLTAGHLHQRGQPRIHRIDTRETALHRFTRRDQSCGDPVRQLPRRPPPQLIRATHRPGCNLVHHNPFIDRKQPRRPLRLFTVRARLPSGKRASTSCRPGGDARIDHCAPHPPKPALPEPALPRPVAPTIAPTGIRCTRKSSSSGNTGILTSARLRSRVAAVFPGQWARSRQSRGEWR